jgi:glycosyltransferase involved in cell wall biosynthesis
MNAPALRPASKAGNGRGGRPLLVFARPGRGNRGTNPYTYLLSEALARCGCTIRELTRRNGVLGRPDVVHIHWPQSEVLGNFAVAVYKFFWMVLRLFVQHRRGAAIVWTVHNLQAHDQNNPRLESALMGIVTRLVSGTIYLSPASRDAAFRRWPRLAARPSAVIPHGLYENSLRAEDTARSARAAFGLPDTRPVIGFLGDIKPYKGMDRILQSFGELQPGEATLFIAGSFIAPADYAAGQRQAISALRAQGHDVVFHEGRLDDRALALAIKACTVNALPYKQITNSGFAMLVLGYEGRILASDEPLFREVQAEVGDAWIACVEGRWTGAALRAALTVGLSAADLESMASFRARRDWLAIAAATIDLYRKLIAARSGSATGGQ